MQVLVLGDEVRTDVNGELFTTEDVGGGLREVCRDATGEQIAIQECARVQYTQVWKLTLVT